MIDYEFPGIVKALEEGCKIHGFRSGGGLRVILINQDGKLKGYGEHPHVEDALSHASEDFLAGQRSYKEVYGKLKPHYTIGDTNPISDLDAWLFGGSTFDAYSESKKITVELNGYSENLSLSKIIKKAHAENFSKAINLAFNAEAIKIA